MWQWLHPHVANALCFAWMGACACGRASLLASTLASHPANALPLAALVSSSICAVGSVRGFDELLPHNPSVVTERRLYQRLAPAKREGHADGTPSVSPASQALLATGLHPVRSILNKLRVEAAERNFCEVRQRVVVCVCVGGVPAGLLSCDARATL